MANHQNRGNRNDGPARTIELTSVPEHVHEAAAHSHDHQEQLTGKELADAGSSNPSGRGSHPHPHTFGHDEISALAHKLWHARGCPAGSAAEDWHEATRQLRENALKG